MKYLDEDQNENVVRKNSMIHFIITVLAVMKLH